MLTLARDRNTTRRVGREELLETRHILGLGVKGPLLALASLDPVEERLEHRGASGIVLEDGGDPAVRLVVVELAKHPVLPVGEDPETRVEALAGAPGARPVPRGLGVGVVPVWARDDKLLPVGRGEG